MSFFPGKDPAPGDAQAADAIDLIILPRSVDVGHFAVRRALPHARRRMVGPFIFFDHFGPAEFHSGQGIDVRRIRISGLRPSLICLTVRSCIATALAPPPRSARARSTG